MGDADLLSITRCWGALLLRRELAQVSASRLRFLGGGTGGESSRGRQSPALRSFYPGLGRIACTRPHALLPSSACFRKCCEKCRRFHPASSSLHLKSLWLSQGSHYVISSLTEVLGPAQLLLPGGKSLVPGAKAAALGRQPGIVPSLHSRGPLSQLMFALGGPNTQPSALNFSLFLLRIAGF